MFLNENSPAIDFQSVTTKIFYVFPLSNFLKRTLLENVGKINLVLYHNFSYVEFHFLYHLCNHITIISYYQLMCYFLQTREQYCLFINVQQ